MVTTPMEHVYFSSFDPKGLSTYNVSAQTLSGTTQLRGITTKYRDLKISHAMYTLTIPAKLCRYTTKIIFECLQLQDPAARIERFTITPSKVLGKSLPYLEPAKPARASAWEFGSFGADWSPKP